VTALVDSSVLIDFLRRSPAAVHVLGSLTEPALSSEICRVEVTRGLRASEESLASELFDLIEWIPVSEPVATLAGELGRVWGHGHSGIGATDLVIAATVELTRSSLLTLNAKHFPMVAGLQPAY
jgi:predicted nucleic acid-binding protein